MLISTLFIKSSGGLGISLFSLFKIFKFTYLIFFYKRKMFLLRSKIQNPAANTDVAKQI